MGLFSKLFKKDPQEELARLEAMIKMGEHGEKTLKLALKLEASSDTSIQGRASQLATQVKASHIADYLESASRSEANGNTADAIDWMKTALPLATGTEKENILLRIRNLEEGDSNTPARPLISARTKSDPVESDEDEIDFDMHFDMLMGMFEPHVADLYQSLPRQFHEAFVTFNSGDVPRAKEIIQPMLEAKPNDPVLQLERGRCAKFDGDYELARDLFAKAWPHFGDIALDHSQTLSIPTLWADVMLELGESEEVIRCLEPLADPKNDFPLMSQTYALALEDAGHYPEAKKFLVSAGSRFNHSANFPFLLSRVMVSMDDANGAINVLEHTAGAACSSGNCGTGIKHPASIRMLISLYLSHGKNLPRVGELLMHLESGLKGMLSKEDLLMTAEFHRLSGDSEAEAAAREEAASLKEGTDSGLQQAIGSANSSNQSAVL